MFDKYISFICLQRISPSEEEHTRKSAIEAVGGRNEGLTNSANVKLFNLTGAEDLSNFICWLALKLKFMLLFSVAGR